MIQEKKIKQNIVCKNKKFASNDVRNFTIPQCHISANLATPECDCIWQSLVVN